MSLDKLKEIDENLWVTLEDDGKKYFIIFGSYTYPGRFSLLDEARQQSRKSSRDEIATASPEATQWIRGFMVGSAPRYPVNFTGYHLPDKHPSVAYFEQQMNDWLEDDYTVQDGSPYGVNNFNFVLQYLLISNQVTREGVEFWIRSRGELASPHRVPLAESAALYSWLDLLKNACSMETDVLVEKMKHEADDVDAPHSMNLYFIFMRNRSLEFLTKPAFEKAIDFFYKDEFWKDEAAELRALLTDSPLQNRKILTERHGVDEGYYEALFWGLDRPVATV